jgi:hypothetical protein
MTRGVSVTALFILCAINTGAKERTGTYFVTADTLAINCRASNRVADGPVPTDADLRKADECNHYIHGVIDTFESARDWDWSPRNESICPPNGFNGDQAIRIFVKYADEHPEELHNSAPSMVWDALHTVFPCAAH